MTERFGQPTPIADARQKAESFVDLLRPYVGKVEIAGSIRRGKAVVNDIDIVTVPHDFFGLGLGLGRVKRRTKKDGSVMDGPNIKCLWWQSVPLDLYLTTAANWSCTLLVRTGSMDHNVGLFGFAKSKGWHLHADGTGLFDARQGGRRLDGGTEESIFEALGVPYRRPQEREIWVHPKSAEQGGEKHEG